MRGKRKETLLPEEAESAWERERISGARQLPRRKGKPGKTASAGAG
jgi:hypothetical protein